MNIRIFFRALTLLGVFWGALLTLKPDPNILFSGKALKGLTEWFNTHGELRNVPAYFLLALCALLSVDARQRRLVLGGVFAVALFLETLQLRIPTRSFDPVDILMSWMGALAAFGLISVFSERSMRDADVRREGPASAKPDALR